MRKLMGEDGATCAFILLAIRCSFHVHLGGDIYFEKIPFFLILKYQLHFFFIGLPCALLSDTHLLILLE